MSLLGPHMLAAGESLHQTLSAALDHAATWLVSILFWLAAIGIVTMAIGIALCLVRIVRGPTLADRALAADTISTQLIGLVILLTVRAGSPYLVDGMLVLALLSFAGTIAAAQFIARPHVQRDLEAEAAAAAAKERDEALARDEGREDKAFIDNVHGPQHVDRNTPS